MTRRAWALAAAATLAGACSSRQDMLEPHGQGAATIAPLARFVFVLFLAVSAATWILIVVVANRRRGSLEEHAPAEAGGGIPWIVAGGITVPAIVLAIVLAGGLQAMHAASQQEGMEQAPAVRVTGHQWWWSIQMGDGPDRIVTANELHVPVGQPVALALESADVIHSFWAPELHGKVDLVPGQVNRMVLRADTPGAYSGQCSEFCGAQHAHMRLAVVADPPEAYAAWLSAQRADAAPPASPQAQHGQDLFLTHACALCHRIRGTPAAATVGPDLTHVASRGLIAATLPNDTAHLEAWITHAQSFKPGCAMPDMTMFTGDELRDLTTYLQGLK